MRRGVWPAGVQAGLAMLVILGALGQAWAEEPLGPSPQSKVFVAHFRVTGSTVFSPEDLRALLAQEEGKELTLVEIEALAGRITARYRGEGYILARAYVPAQEIRESVVEIAVLEGRVGGIEVKGARWYAPEYLRSYVQPDPEAPAFHAGRHERGLLLLNDLPGLQVKSTLRPGAEVGTTDIVLEVEKDRLVTAAVDANNYGSDETGRERFGVSLSLNNPLGRGDALSFRGLASRKGEGLWFTRLSYALPVNTLGTKVGAAYTHVQAAATVRGLVRDVDARGAGDVASLYAVHPLLRTRELSFDGYFGFDYKQLTSSTQDQDQGGISKHDRLRVFTLGWSLNTIDRWRGISNISLTLHQGVGGFLGGLRGDDDPNASRPGAGGTFTKLTLEVSRLQQIIGPTSLFLKGSGQWASTGLVAPEQFIVGGQGTVRGYPIAEISGDNGYAVTAEFRWNAPGFSDVPAFLGKKWGDILQFFLFVDHGAAILRDPLSGEKRYRRLNGGGVGLQLGIPDNFLLKVEFARRINHPRASDGLDNVIYFLAGKSF